MNHFLVKADPEDYSIQDLQREGETLWDGVHNYQAINVIKTMRPGDHVYIYHSMSQKAVVGEAEVVGKPFQNTADPRFSWAVTLKFKRIFDNPISLADIKGAPELREFILVRHSRLSVMPVPEDVHEWLASRVGQE